MKLRSGLLMYVKRGLAVLGLAPLLWALSAFSQDGASADHAKQRGEEALRLAQAEHSFAMPTSTNVESVAEHAATAAQEERDSQMSDLHAEESSTTPGNKTGDDSKDQSFVEKVGVSKPADFNREIYYRNKLEFSLDGGWLPLNVPFPLDVFVGDVYNTYPLKYTLVPIFASVRWQLDDVGSPWILRGNWDLTFTGSVTAIPRGPESHYLSYLMGIRRNFVQPNRRIAPYFDVRLGLGSIDAKGPKGVLYAQGENLTFTVNMGSGVRYNFNPRYSISAGLNFMHISNLDLSQGNGKPSWGIRNYGINVYGPMVGINIQLGKHQRQSAH
jgi:lipid A 3-O-deacylase PagL